MAKSINKKSINLLPAIFRTEKNDKFLASTIDQFIKTPQVERLNSFAGTKITSTYNPKTDFYIDEGNTKRAHYQLEPSLIINDVAGSIKKAYGFDDLLNQIDYSGGKSDNIASLFAPDFDSYDPSIDWDKFINYREYFWLTGGPDTVYISSTSQNGVKSEFIVNDSDENNLFVFGNSEVTDPILYLYKGQTYTFTIYSSKSFFITTENRYSDAARYSNAAGNGSTTVTLIVDNYTPSTLFYTSSDSEVAGGRIVIREASANPVLDVEADIIGKLHYEFSNGVSLVNGLRIGFEGNVVPSKYKDFEYYVEGVGNGIKLVNISELTTPEPIAEIINETFGTGGFGPFDVSKTVAVLPEYTTINRASTDRNPWSRYNRWFHVSAIEMAAKANGVEVVLPVDYRAKRPIIEFAPGIKLWNFGDYAITPADLIDTVTIDPFTDVNGGVGFIVDGVEVYDGMRIIFSAATDPLIKNKVYLLTTPVVDNVLRISLTVDETVTTGACVIVKKGNTRRGTEWWFNSSSWHRAQERTIINQAPLFDLYDSVGNSYSSSGVYNTSFTGNKVFSYAVGSGVVDPVLGFPLKYKNVGVEATFLFENYFSNGSFNVVVETSSNVPEVYAVKTSATYLNINGKLKNVWTKASGYTIPILQFQVISDIVDSIPVTVIDNPGTLLDLKVDVFVNDAKLVPSTFGSSPGYELVVTGNDAHIRLLTPIDGRIIPSRVLLKVYTTQNVVLNDTGYYEIPVNLTNNPTNGNIYQFTLSELSNHVKTMVDLSSDFVGKFPGYSNLNTLPEPISAAGSRLIKNNNPVIFSQFFLASTDHNVISAIRTVATDYYQFKLNLVRQFALVNNSNVALASDVLDMALKEVNRIKGAGFPYARSDMLGYGNSAKVWNYVVSNIRNNQFPLATEFTMSSLSEHAILVSINNVTLLHGIDYTFSEDGTLLIVRKPLVRNDKVTVKYYPSTVGSFVPPTPTKLGLYPKFQPSIFVDDTYAGAPVKVIQGHDGSITVALSKVGEPDDYRDLALLEFEKRIFNNIKVEYNRDLLNLHDVLPRAFSSLSNSYNAVYSIVHRDFINWCNLYGIDAEAHTSFDINDYKTYNFRDSGITGGSWRGVYQYFFDTDKPHLTPWEMLGFFIKPSWWESEYGIAPYSSENLKLWSDLQVGRIRGGDRAGVDQTYARPLLDQMIPVDEHGNLIDIRKWQMCTDIVAISSPDARWKFGDFGPAEVAWRRSSLWAFEMQIIMALSKPATYASRMFDPSRMVLNAVLQYVYAPSNNYLALSDLEIFSDVVDSTYVMSAGYSVLVVEAGYKKNANYASILKEDLSNTSVKLMYKAGGFLSKSKLDVIVDSVSPDTANPGVILPVDDYDLHFNVSSPVRTVAISGIIISRTPTGFTVRGYDTINPYFTVTMPNRFAASMSATVTVGGKSAKFYPWETNKFYQYGQVVQYLSKYYTVRVGHNSGTTFDINNYDQISSLPTEGGITVLDATRFENTTVDIMYGTVLETAQDVYDVIVGYGNWLETQGFLFNEYVSELNQVVNWKFSGKEFLFWTTQQWADSAVITISPFSDSLSYEFKDSVVDNVLDSFYNYSLLTANGVSLSRANITVNRSDNVCKISTRGTADGIFFARLELVQKEHAIVLNNSSMFNDVIYDTQTGYRQSRIKLVGFKTADWDGNYQSPGFMYDSAVVSNWEPYKSYTAADVVKHSGKYYSAKSNIQGTSSFDYSKWVLLGNKPVVQLLPNFDYKIDQFNEFYSLDIDNFDISQQRMAQHLIGYTPREYLQNIFVNPVAQYKFYQGFIKEKGSKNAIKKLAKASIHNLQGEVEYTEEWAFRSGEYGGFTAYDEIEFVLPEENFYENSQVVQFVDYRPAVTDFESILYVQTDSLTIKPDEYNYTSVVPVVSDTDVEFVLPVAGYANIDDVNLTAFNSLQLLELNTSTVVTDNTAVRTVIWVASTVGDNWDVYRCIPQTAKITSVTAITTGIMFITDVVHGLTVGERVAVTGINDALDTVYEINTVNADDGSLKYFTSTAVRTPIPNTLQATATISKLVSARTSTSPAAVTNVNVGELVWVDSDVANSNKWAVYKKTTTSWDLFRLQTPVVNINGFEKAYIYNTLTNSVIDYLDILDPVKGNVLGVADQEIRFKTGFDPAVYATGIDGVNVDVNSRWLDAHVGELWWDLSTIKYVWYEQGDITYKKNNWGAAFPGSSVDVYEWVRSEYLPSQWAGAADTISGLSVGISGQPKYADDTVYSARIVTDPVSGSTKAIYYYWVKRPSLIPSGVKNRRISANEVSQLLENPAGYGTMYMSPIDQSAILLVNVKQYVQNHDISLNFSKVTVNNVVNRHTEWILIDEGSSASMPTPNLNKKLIDSLMKSDVLGNPVPDDDLPVRQKYGISIRPRQSMFINSTEALRNVIEYANSVLRLYKITEMVGFDSLTSSEEIPAVDYFLYDVVVEDQLGLANVKTNGIRTAELSCEVIDGKIVEVSVVDGGEGYIDTPSITVAGNTSGAVLQAVLTNGAVTSVVVKNSGSGFVTSPVLTVRDFSAIVMVDEQSSNRWALYSWTNNQWVKIRNQKYNVAQYWEYVDWAATSYDPLKPLFEAVDYSQLVASASVAIGNYIKVNNQGNGKYVILEKIDDTGDLNTDYAIVYSELATIQFKDIVWKIVDSTMNWDILSYDKTFYDQYPTYETYSILMALKDEIFIGPLKVYWNKLFFKAVRYALSEQKFLDWAFKTSFINVKNKAGALEQRPVFKFQNSKYYEDYINEVKPYRTKIRNYQVDYTVDDAAISYSSDFDCPAIYDSTSEKYVIPSIEYISSTYPHKSWYDNHTLHLDSIVIVNGGSGFVTQPSVVITPAAGDAGSGATAVAYISLGSINNIVVTNPGAGYKVQPIITVIGGGENDVVAPVLVPVLRNGKVRAISLVIKFDRTDSVVRTSTEPVIDEFVSNGRSPEYELTWYASEDKSKIEVFIDNKWVISSAYSIAQYTSTDRYNYTKKYSKLIFPDVQAEGAVIKIVYRKNIELFNAIERLAYYAPTSGMPSANPADVMSGIQYSGINLDTLPMAGQNSSYVNWDENAFDSNMWDDVSNDAELTSIIDGGKLDYTTATGVSPTDVIFDGGSQSSVAIGDGFFNPVSTPAAEECVFSGAYESLSISVITNSQVTAGKKVGFRQFTDILSRSHYKRVGSTASTTLTAPINLNSTYIDVANATVLTQPAVVNGISIPGVIFVNGERIEFKTVTGNRLSTIRRGTLGTGAKTTHATASVVVDQGVNSTIPYVDSFNRAMFTVTDTSMFEYSLVNFNFVNDTSISSQVEVKLAGKKLSKDGYYVHDISVAFDSPYIAGNINTVTTVDDLPMSYYVGTAFLVTATNEVWVFTDSKLASAVNGFVNSGLKWVPPEYTVHYLTPTTALLRISLNVQLVAHTKITVSQKVGKSWYSSTTQSIADDTSTIAVFLGGDLASGLA